MAAKKYTKAELIKLAKQHGYFSRAAVSFVWARQNGHFYYNEPPMFNDGFESYKIVRSDIEVKKKVVKKK